METNIPRRRISEASSNGSQTASQNGSQKTMSAEEAARFQSVLSGINNIKIPLTMLAVMQQAGKSDTEVSPYALDVYTISEYEKPLALGIVELATMYPVLGALLDKIAVGGPLVGLLAAALALTVQLAENHGVLPPVVKQIFPVNDRTDLAHKVREEGEKKAAELRYLAESMSAE